MKNRKRERHFAGEQLDKFDALAPERFLTLSSSSSDFQEKKNSLSLSRVLALYTRSLKARCRYDFESVSAEEEFRVSAKLVETVKLSKRTKVPAALAIDRTESNAELETQARPTPVTVGEDYLGKICTWTRRATTKQYVGS